MSLMHNRKQIIICHKELGMEDVIQQLEYWEICFNRGHKQNPSSSRYFILVMCKKADVSAAL